MTELRTDKILDVLRFAKKYQFQKIYDTILISLEEYLTLENVVSVLSFAMENQNEEMTEKCYKFLDGNALEFTANTNFLRLSESSLLGLLKRDTFAIDEMKIFTATSKWCEQNPITNQEEIKNAIRFSLIETSALVNLTSMALSPSQNEILEAIRMRKSSQLNVRKRSLKNQLTYRSKQRLLEELDAKVIQGICTKICIDGTWHEIIDFDKNKHIVIEFNTIRNINHIEFKLEKSAGYVIEVSLDKKEWKKVIDYSKYLCDYEQSLFFDTEQVKFIKIYCSTLNYTNITNFLPQLTDSVPPRANDIVVATKGVIEKAEIKGYYKLLRDGFQENYETRDILISFNQPYLMQSLSFDCGGKYRFQIEGNFSGNPYSILIKTMDTLLQGHCVFEFNPTIIKMIVFRANEMYNNHIRVTNISVPAQEITTDPISK